MTKRIFFWILAFPIILNGIWLIVENIIPKEITGKISSEWIVTGICFGIGALIAITRYRSSGPSAETKKDEEEKNKKELTPYKSRYATTILFLIFMVLALTMIVHRIDTGRWGFAKSTEIQAEFRPLASAFEMPAAAIQDLDGFWRVPVLANKLIVDSTLQAKKGQGIIITATGQANGCKNRYDAAYGWIGPEGRKWSWNKKRKRPLGPDSPFMALCAKIGENGKWFKVGQQISFRAPQSGKIFFTVNDDIYDASGRFRPDWIKDNEGEFIVKVKIDC